MTDTQHRLADGTPVILGMRVRDYDRKYGVIEDNLRSQRALAEPHQHHTSSGVEPIPEGQEAVMTCDAWFDVLRDDGTRNSFDCSRMIAEGGRLDR